MQTPTDMVELIRSVNAASMMCFILGALFLLKAWRETTIGTKSVLVGVHQFLIHPILIAIGWWKAYGLEPVRIGTEEILTNEGATVRRGVYAHLLEPALWFAFFVHDIGYLGKPNMDGPEGESHPELGAKIVRWFYGDVWGDFCLYHSRYYAKAAGQPVSALCIADKWVIVLEPSVIYIPRAWLSGELTEYITNAHRRTQDPTGLTATEIEAFSAKKAWSWHRGVKVYMRRWLAENAAGQVDTMTRVRHAEVR